MDRAGRVDSRQVRWFVPVPGQHGPDPGKTHRGKRSKMRFEELHSDDDAVAPVIAVILMVSVAVVIVGIAGIFIFDQSGVNVSPAPQAQFTLQHNETVTSTSGCEGNDGFDASNGELEIEHQSGDSITADNLTIIGADPDDRGFHECSSLSAESQVTTNDAAYVEASEDDTVRLIWKGGDENTSYVIAKWEGQAEN